MNKLTFQNKSTVTASNRMTLCQKTCGHHRDKNIPKEICRLN